MYNIAILVEGKLQKSLKEADSKSFTFERLEIMTEDFEGDKERRSYEGSRFRVCGLIHSVPYFDMNSCSYGNLTNKKFFLQADSFTWRFFIFHLQKALCKAIQSTPSFATAPNTTAHRTENSSHPIKAEEGLVMIT